MKIRTGFVTNSSSSSYLIAIGKDSYEKVASNMHPVFQFIVEYFLSKDIATLFDKQVVILSGEFCDSNFGWATKDQMPEGSSHNKKQKEIVVELEYSNCHNADDMRRTAEGDAFNMFITALADNGAYHRIKTY